MSLLPDRQEDSFIINNSRMFFVRVYSNCQVSAISVLAQFALEWLSLKVAIRI